MSSSFLKGMAAQTRKKIDKEFGSDYYGGSNSKLAGGTPISQAAATKATFDGGFSAGSKPLSLINQLPAVKVTVANANRTSDVHDKRKVVQGTVVSTTRTADEVNSDIADVRKKISRTYAIGGNPVDRANSTLYQQELKNLQQELPLAQENDIEKNTSRWEYLSSTKKLSDEEQAEAKEAVKELQSYFRNSGIAFPTGKLGALYDNLNNNLTAQSGVGAFLFGTMSGVSAGTLDTATDYITKKLNESAPEDQQLIQPFQRIKENHPTAYGAGEIVGSFAPYGIAERGVATAVKGAIKLSPLLTRAAATTVGKVATRAAIGGTTMGLVSGAESALEGNDAGKVLKDVAGGAAIGATFEVGLAALGAVGKSIIRKLKSGKALTAAEREAAEAVAAKTGSTLDDEAAKMAQNPVDDVANIVEPKPLDAEPAAVKTVPAKENPAVNASPENHIDNRTYSSVSKRKVNAFQFDHPELHEYYVSAAKDLLNDMSETIKGERFPIKNELGEIVGYTGNKRYTTDEISRLLDETNLSYDDIKKALEAIIKDSGQENYAAAKKVELILDDMLTKGGVSIDGRPYPPNEEYIAIKSRLPGGENEIYAEDWDSLYANEPVETASYPENDSVGAARAGFDETGALVEKYGAIPEGEAPHADDRLVEVPAKTSDDKYVSAAVRTAMESPNTPFAAAEAIEKEIPKERFSFERITDKGAIERATKGIENKGYEIALRDWTAKARSGRVSKDLVTEGQILFNAAADAGDTKGAIDILTDLVTMQRSGAQATQAGRILKKLSPQGRLYALQRSVSNYMDELIAKYGKMAPDLKIDEALAQEFLDAATDAERATAYSKIIKNIADQVPSTFADKWNAWRYMSMLTNPITHIRNIVSNTVFGLQVRMKNVLASGIESGADKASTAIRGKGISRTKSVLTMADKDLIKAADDDFVNVVDDIVRNGKYNDPTSEIDEARTIFKNNGEWGTKADSNPIVKAVRKASDKTKAGAEWVRKGNTYLLNKEDILASRPTYTKSLAGYLKAKGITAADFAAGKVPSEVLDEARAYAVKEAQKATFRDGNIFSDWVSSLGKNRRSKNPVAKGANVLVEGVLPFKRTPANILARGLEYSPIGLVKGLTYDLFQVAKGAKTAAEAIDQIASGLVGTSLCGAGAFLSSLGVLTVGGTGDEKQDDFNDLQGNQVFALQIGGESYTIDWLSPAAMPLFVGAAIFNKMTDESAEGITLNSVLDTIEKITDPALETSMLKSFNDYLAGIGNAQLKGENVIAYMLAQATMNYLGQAVPTLFGRVARTIDDTRRTTFIDKNSQIPGDVQYFLQKNKNKIPFAISTSQPYIDAWGREESNGPLAVRILQNTVSPGYISEIKTSPMEQELQRLYKSTGENVLPSNAPKYITVNGKRYDMTAEEYTAFAKARGQEAYQNLTELTSSDAYKTMSDAEKAEAVKDVYDAASENGKRQLVESRGEMYLDATGAEKVAAFKEAAKIDDEKAYALYKKLNALGSSAPSAQKLELVANDNDLLGSEKLQIMQVIDKGTTIKKIASLPQYGVSADEAVEVYKAIAQAEKNEDKLNAIARLNFDQRKAATIISDVIYTSYDEDGNISKRGLLKELNASEALVSLYNSTGDTDCVSMTVPDKFTKDKVEYELNGREKDLFQQKYVSYFDSYSGSALSGSNATRLQRIKKLRDNAYNFAKSAVIAWRG